MQDLPGLKPYRTIRRESEAELVIQKSRFIGRCFPISSETEAHDVLDGIRKRFWDATHHCHAFCIGTDALCSRSSDDGEPSGTAGAPILNVLLRTELTNVMCVVTRYFGGVLLGAGGLIRAYSNAAAAAIEAAGAVWMRPADGYRAMLSYSQWAALETMLRKEAEVAEVVYTDVVTLTFWLDASQAALTLRRITDASDGRVVPELIDRQMRSCD